MSERFFTREQKDILLARQEYMCGECGRDLWRMPGRYLAAHHIVSHWQGGATDVDNGVILCPDCHLKYDTISIVGTIYPGVDVSQAEPSMIENRRAFFEGLTKIRHNRNNPQLTLKIGKVYDFHLHR